MGRGYSKILFDFIRFFIGIFLSISITWTWAMKYDRDVHSDFNINGMKAVDIGIKSLLILGLAIGPGVAEDKQLEHHKKIYNLTEKLREADDHKVKKRLVDALHDEIGITEESIINMQVDDIMKKEDGLEVFVVPNEEPVKKTKVTEESSKNKPEEEVAKKKKKVVMVEESDDE